jgi:hypothetical protein
MNRLTVCLVVIGCLSGCHGGSRSSYNVLAPYGSSRVPPPATGGQHAASGYYDRTAPANATAPTIQPNAANQPGVTQTLPNQQSAAASLAAGSAWKPANTATSTAAQSAPATGRVDSQVQRASFISDAEAEPEGVDDSSSQKLKLNGMPVNDATQLTIPSEPARFAPPPGTPLTPLPQTAGASSGTVVSSAKASDNLAPPSLKATTTLSGANSTLNWRSRY